MREMGPQLLVTALVLLLCLPSRGLTDGEMIRDAGGRWAADPNARSSPLHRLGVQYVQIGPAETERRRELYTRMVETAFPRDSNLPAWVPGMPGRWNADPLVVCGRDLGDSAIEILHDRLHATPQHNATIRSVLMLLGDPASMPDLRHIDRTDRARVRGILASSVLQGAWRGPEREEIRALLVDLAQEDYVRTDLSLLLEVINGLGSYSDHPEDAELIEQLGPVYEDLVRTDATRSPDNRAFLQRYPQWQRAIEMLQQRLAEPMHGPLETTARTLGGARAVLRANRAGLASVAVSGQGAITQLDTAVGRPQLAVFADRDRKVILVNEFGALMAWSTDDPVSLEALALSSSGELRVGPAPAALAADNDAVALALRNQRVRVFRLGSEQPALQVRADDTPSSLAISVAADLLVVGLPHGGIQLWRLSDGSPLTTLRTTLSDVECLGISRDGQVIGAGDTSGVAVIIEPRTGVLLRRSDPREPGVHRVVGIHLGEGSVAVLHRLTMQLDSEGTPTWYMAIEHLPFRSQAHAVRSEIAIGAMSRVGLASNGQFAVTSEPMGGETATLHVWNLETATLSGDHLSWTSPATALAISASGQRVVAVCADGSARLWGQ
jgi:hypothetical protein